MVDRNGSLGKVEKYLNAKLNECNSGDRLPSIRQIKQDCGVSQSVVDKVITRLLIEGEIKIRRPSGLFKAERPVPRIKILNFKPVYGHGFYHYVISELLNVLASRNRQIELIPVSDTSDIPEIISDNNATYITFCLDWQDYASVSSCERIIHLLPNFVEQAPPSLVIDDSELIEAQLKLLTCSGHRKIAYLHTYEKEHYSRAQTARWDAFHHKGFELKLDFNQDYLVYTKHSDSKKVIAAIDKLLKLPEPPTALLLCSDEQVSQVYQSIKDNGFEAGRDIAVLGTNNQNFCQYTTPQLSSIGFAMREGLDMLVNMLEDIENGGTGEVLTFPLDIGDRDSINII